MFYRNGMEMNSMTGHGQIIITGLTGGLKGRCFHVSTAVFGFPISSIFTIMMIRM